MAKGDRLRRTLTRIERNVCVGTEQRFKRPVAVGLHGFKPHPPHHHVSARANDPTAKAIVKESNISSEKIKEVGNTVANIRVSGVKPP